MTLSQSLNYLKKLYSNLANDLVHKLPAASKKFDIEAVKDYYNDMFELSHNKLNFQTVQPNTISNLLKSCNVNKAAKIDNVSGRILKDGADVLGIPITQICNLSIRLCHFLKDCKKVLRQILKSLDQYHFYQ